jgi:hypothetical protein
MAKQHTMFLLTKRSPPAILAHFRASTFTPSNRVQLKVFGSLLLGPMIHHITNHQFQYTDRIRPQALTMGGTESMYIAAIPLDQQLAVIQSTVILSNPQSRPTASSSGATCRRLVAEMPASPYLIHPNYETNFRSDFRHIHHLYFASQYPAPRNLPSNKNSISYISTMLIPKGCRPRILDLHDHLCALSPSISSFLGGGQKRTPPRGLHPSDPLGFDFA